MYPVIVHITTADDRPCADCGNATTGWPLTGWRITASTTPPTEARWGEIEQPLCRECSSRLMGEAWVMLVDALNLVRDAVSLSLLDRRPESARNVLIVAEQALDRERGRISTAATGAGGGP